MPIIAGGVAGAAPAPPPFEAFDEVGVSGGAVSFSAQGSERNNGTASPFWGTGLGGGHGWAGPSAGGPLTGIRHRQSFGVGVGAKTDFIDWRLGQRWSLSNPSPLVVLQRKFTFECAVASSGNGSEIAIKQVPDLFNSANTVLGIGLQVAGGNWTGRQRLVTGAVDGGFGVLQAFSAAVARRVRFEFTEGPIPVLECFMDGALMFTRSGEANMPELSVGFGLTYGPAVASGAAVTVATAGAMLRMEYI